MQPISLWLVVVRQSSSRVAEDGKILKWHFYRKLGLMLLWAKITSIRRTESETQKLVVCSLIAAPNGSILGTLTARVIGISEGLLLFNAFIFLITLGRLSMSYRCQAKTWRGQVTPEVSQGAFSRAGICVGCRKQCLGITVLQLMCLRKEFALAFPPG